MGIATAALGAFAAMTFLASPLPAREAGAPAANLASGRLHLDVTHRMETGRLVVRLGGRAFYSAPFAGRVEIEPGRFQYPLYVPAGQQVVTVQLIDGRGKLVAEKATEGMVPESGPAVLEVVEHRGTGDGLTLTWRTP